MPRHHIIWTVILLILESLSHITSDYFPCYIFIVLISCWRCTEISFICKSIWADRAKVRDLKVSLVALSHPTSYILTILSVKWELNSTRNHDDFSWLHSEFTELGCDKHDSSLWNDEYVSISRIKSNSISMHACLERESAYAQTIFHLRISSTHHSLDWLMEHTLLRFLWWPSQLLRCHIKSFISVKIRDPT